MPRTRLRLLTSGARLGIQRLRRLSVADVLLLVQAVYALPLAAVALRRHGLGTVRERLARLWTPAPGVATTVDHRQAAKVAWLVHVAAAYGPYRANCLQRSVVLGWFLERRGLAHDLRIGVRRDPAGGLAFHAWVEHDGRVVNDSPDVQVRFVTFDRAIAPREARFT